MNAWTPRPLSHSAMSTPSGPTLRVLFPPPAATMTAIPLALSAGARWTSIDGLWMFSTDSTRSEFPDYLKTSGLSHPGSSFSIGEPLGQSVTTFAPGTIG